MGVKHRENSLAEMREAQTTGGGQGVDYEKRQKEIEAVLNAMLGTEEQLTMNN
jgi:hypothetical protein